MPRKDIESRRTYMREHYAANRDRLKAAANAHYAANGADIQAARLVKKTEEVRALLAATSREEYRRLRCEMIAAYGGSCECCGEAETVFLELDHINDDGAEHRRLIGRGSRQTYAWLKRQGWPRESHRLLCANCNQGRARNGGICPHQMKRAANG